MKKANQNQWIANDFDDFDCFKVPKVQKRKASQIASSTKKSDATAANVRETSIWSDDYKPKSLDQLAVHPKKVDEVKTWLSNQKLGNGKAVKPGILLLRGPPGSGKTATLQTVAKHLDFCVQDWTNPTENGKFVPREQGDFGSFDDSVPYISQTKSFKNFMLRANRYAVLGESQHKILLIEELPTFVLRDPAEFHSCLRAEGRRFPLVIIHSEQSSSKEDRLKKFLPPEVIVDLKVDQILFNAVAPTILVKALTDIIQIEKQKKRNKTLSFPDKTSLSALAASVNGDIRGAVNALQFACVRGNLQLL